MATSKQRPKSAATAPSITLTTAASARSRRRNSTTTTTRAATTTTTPPRATTPVVTTLRRISAPEVKMDASRAQYILGFSNSKRLDPSSSDEFKAALDKALAEQMQKITLKQIKHEKEEKQTAKNGKDPRWRRRGLGYGLDQKKIAQFHVEFINLHEAYQFLIQKNQTNEMKKDVTSVRRNTLVPDVRLGSVGIPEERDGDDSDEDEHCRSSHI